MTRQHFGLPFKLTPQQDLILQTMIKTGSFLETALELNLARPTIYDQMQKARLRAGAPNMIRLVVLYLQNINSESPS